ncbi:MAG: hypothetical protein JO249_17630 [Acidobacteria bacterium]|nr:hypothetical protein [Acidobacteriota bacterium]
MTPDDSIDDLDLRILRVTEDLRAIQRELNCAVLQASADPELMESLNGFSQRESLEVLRSALDQMRHFLWFYKEMLGSESEVGEKLRRAVRQGPSADAVQSRDSTLVEKIKSAAGAAMLQYLTDGKIRKPN